jgi:hypothetical protein
MALNAPKNIVLLTSAEPALLIFDLVFIDVPDVLFIGSNPVSEVISL